MTGTNRTRTPPHILTLVTLSGVSALSMNVFLPSLPGMARDFGVDYAVMQLSVTAYLGANAILQLLIGPISDRFGRRPVMLGALVIFLLASVGTLLATNAALFLFFRMVQAAITAGLVLSRAVVRDMVPGPEAASLLGYVTMGMSVVPMIAPMIGGVLDEAFGWRANFSMLLAVGAAVLVLTWFDMGETARGGGVPLRQQVATYPVLARSQRFWGYALTSMLASGSFFAYLGGAPFVGINVFGLSPAEVGYYFAAPSVGYFLGNYIAGRWSARMGFNMMILVGSAAAAAALGATLLADLADFHNPLIFFGAVGFVGLGNGMVLPNANAGMMSVRPELAGTASGLGGAMTLAGGAILSSIAGAMLHDGSGALPLIAIMTLSAIGSVFVILWVIRRERQVTGLSR